LSNLIKIKRSATSAAPSQLSNGELAWTEAGNVVFIGSYDGTRNVPIAGARTPGTLTANQAIVVNSTSMIDAIRVGNSSSNIVLVSTGLTIANSTNTITIVPPSTAQKAGTYYLKADGSWATAIVAPGGSNTDIQFNNSGTLDGTDNIQWNNTSNTLTVTGNLTVTGIMTVNASLISVANLTSNVNITPDTISVQNTISNVSISMGSVTIANTSNTITIVPPSTVQKAGSYYLKADGSWSLVSGSGTPSGSNTQIQFNDSGAFGADTLFAWNKTAEALMIGNSTVNVVVNTSSVSIGSNVQFTTVKGSYGNSTVNATVNSLGLALNGTQVVVNNSVIQNGANVIIDTVKAGFGNSTVNATVNSVAVAFNGVQTVNATGVSAGLLYGAQVNSTANISFTGANVSIPNANLSVKDVNISGNLTVLGTMTTIDATNLQVHDPMIKLADNNASDTIDIGFYGLYNDGVNNRFTGLFRDATNGNYVLWANNLAEPTTTVDTANTSFAIATLQSYLVSGNLISNSTGVAIGANSTYAVTLVANTLTLSTPLAGPSGGTGLASYASGDMLVANSTNGFSKMSVPATDGSMIQWSSGGGVAWSATIDCGTF